MGALYSRASPWWMCPDSILSTMMIPISLYFSEMDIMSSALILRLVVEVLKGGRDNPPRANLLRDAIVEVEPRVRGSGMKNAFVVGLNPAALMNGESMSLISSLVQVDGGSSILLMTTPEADMLARLAAALEVGLKPRRVGHRQWWRGRFYLP